MQSGQPPRRRAWPASIAALAALGALTPATALGAATPPGDGALSPRLAELAEPAVRSAPPAKQAEALSLAAEGPGSLVREGNRVLVEVRFSHGAAAAVEGLRQAGAEVVNVSRHYQTVTVAARPDELLALNGVPRMRGAEEVLQPIAASTCPSGAVVSEGVRQLHAGDGEFEAEGALRDEARKAFGVDGAGVTVGILSDSYNRATEAAYGGGPVATTASKDVSNGDLPGIGNTCAGQATPVGVLDDSDTSGEDEGRAMAQIVHDVAPGAGLAFATAFNGETAFAENIERLARPVAEGGAGARAIVDDVSYFSEPFFQEGPVAVAVSKVSGEGVSYFSSAGNNNLIDGGRDIASWEAPEYRDSGGCPAGVVALSAEYEELEERLEEEPGLELPGIGLNASHCLDFDPSESSSDDTFGITVQDSANLVVDLQWAEPWYGVGTDLDAFLLDESGNVIAESPYANEVRPYEALSWKNSSGSSKVVRLVVNRYAGGAPRVKLALLQNGGGVTSTEYEESSPGPGGDVVGPTVFGHNGGEDTISVGAIRYSSTTAPERYSSRGPVTHYFGPVEGTAPAAALGSPRALAKPDLTATDCGVTSFFAFESAGSWRFCGTSAAAPHAAGVAALMLQRDPAATPGQIRDGLAGSARPVGSFGPDAVGAGLVDAVGALASVSAEPPDVIRSERTEPAPVPVAPGEEIPTSHSVQAVSPAPAPITFFRKRPPKVVQTRRHSARRAFLFGSDQAGVAFLCKVDRGRFHRCRAWLVRRWSLGRHVLRVKARRSSDGATDATPAVYRFRVKRVRHGPVRRRHTRHHSRG